MEASEKQTVRPDIGPMIWITLVEVGSEEPGLECLIQPACILFAAPAHFSFGGEYTLIRFKVEPRLPEDLNDRTHNAYTKEPFLEFTERLRSFWRRERPFTPITIPGMAPGESIWNSDEERGKI